jgi:hypothetical protein
MPVVRECVLLEDFSSEARQEEYLCHRTQRAAALMSRVTASRLTGQSVPATSFSSSLGGSRHWIFSNTNNHGRKHVANMYAQALRASVNLSWIQYGWRDGSNNLQRQTIARVAFRQPAMIRTFITPTAVRQGIY